MKVDWKKRYYDLKREHDAKMRCEIYIPKIAQILGVKYANFFERGNGR